MPGSDRIVPRGRAAGLLPGLLRFLGLWAGLTGLYAMAGAPCPCCGKTACPVGHGTAIALGALGSFIILKGRSVVGRLRRSPGRPKASP